MFYVYILKLSHGLHYTGFTADLKQRLKRHLSKNSVNITKTNDVLELEFYASFKDKKRALDFEKYLKSSSGSAFRNKRLI